MRAPSAVVLAAAVLAAICGCTATTTHSRTHTGAPSAVAAPTHSSSPSPSPRPAISSDPPTLPPDADQGPQPGASGTVIRNSAGNPVTYVVASGDTPANIAARFGVSVEDFTSRANLGYATIYPGEKLTLIW